MLPAQPLSIHGARVWRDNRLQDNTALHGARLLTENAAADALQVDLSGFDLYPAMINAHDHLELNHFPRTRFRECYANAHEWGEDVSARLDTEPFRSLRALPLPDRLFAGGLKNLLCGALTVVQHNPPHKLLFHPRFPVSVIANTTWAHSLHFSSDVDIRRAHAATTDLKRFYIHLAEGTDQVAAREYSQLKALGVVDSRTLIIHGVGLLPDDVPEAVHLLGGLITCPTTNRYLLGKTADVAAWKAEGGRVALGSDSRLTADGDLLDELRAFAALCESPQAALRAVWDDAAAVVGCSAGRLQPGLPNDWIAVPSGKPLVTCTRTDLALIVRGGRPQLGDPEIMARFPVESAPVQLDGTPKAIRLDLARRIAGSSIAEPGLLIGPLPVKRWLPSWRKIRQ